MSDMTPEQLAGAVAVFDQRKSTASSIIHQMTEYFRQGHDRGLTELQRMAATFVLIDTSMDSKAAIVELLAFALQRISVLEDIAGERPEVDEQLSDEIKAFLGDLSRQLDAELEEGDEQ